jgi:molecular chaperone GrpE
MTEPAPVHDELTPEEVHDKWLRALAELDNLRKRKAKEIEDARDQGEAYAASVFLPIIDDMRRAMEAMNRPRARKKDILEGIQLVFNRFGAILEQLSIEGFESEGRRFTYELMEAITEVPTREALPGTVVGEIERGYTRRGRLLRPAKVAVAVEPKEE